MRWATVTVNVLKIRKPPTSSATPAKIEQRDADEAERVGEVLRLLLGRLLAGLDLEVAPQLALQRGLDLVRVLAAGRDRDRVPAVVAGHPVRLVGREHANRAPPRLSLSPSDATPEIVNCLAGAAPAIVTLSPTLKS